MRIVLRVIQRPFKTMRLGENMQRAQFSSLAMGSTTFVKLKEGVQLYVSILSLWRKHVPDFRCRILHHLGIDSQDWGIQISLNLPKTRCLKQHSRCGLHMSVH
jgi:hypothetical protein